MTSSEPVSVNQPASHWGLTSAISLYLPSMEVFRSKCLRVTGVPGRERWGLRGLGPVAPHRSAGRGEREIERQRKREREGGRESQT